MGYTVGGGLEMGAAVRRRESRASDRANFRCPKTGAGMIPRSRRHSNCGAPGLDLAARSDLCLTGRWIDASDRVTCRFWSPKWSPVADLDARRFEYRTRGLGEVPRERASMLKRAVWEGLDLPLREGLELEQRLAKRLMLMTANDNRTPRPIADDLIREKRRRPGRNRAL